MSHTVVRGTPYASQLYFDRILDAVLSAKGIQPDPMERDRLTMSEIIFHCMKTNPQEIHMINGLTGEMFTNEYILKQSVTIARSLVAKCPKMETVMLVMRNHQNMVATYWATMFAGVLPFMMDPNTTEYELVYFLKLIEPKYVFCDREHYEDLNIAIEKTVKKPKLIIANEAHTLREFTHSFSDDIENFQISQISPESSVLLLPTSGSTGFPKAALLCNKGLVAQTPVQWAYYTQFPKPTKLAMLLTTAQWATFTMTMNACVPYNVPLLMSPRKLSVEHVIEMLAKYRPTWTFFSPAFVKSLLASSTAEQLSCLQTVILLGAPPTPDTISGFKEKLEDLSYLKDWYGCTEAQGSIAQPDNLTPINSNGRINNVYYYKVIDENGTEVKPGNNGELYIQGESLIKGYYKDEDSFKESFVDGWFRTGDWFYLDVDERLYFLEKRKFSFKFRGCQVSPEEVEAVINSVDGVRESVVCATDSGPAAAVVLHPDCSVSRHQIHDAVTSKLSDHKRLHGGLALVPSLPQTHSGKLQRRQCKDLIHQLIKEGKCY